MQTAKRVSVLSCLVAALFLAAPVFAAPQEEHANPCEKNPELCEKTSRFLPHEPSYLIYNFTEDDEGALEAHYSFKYLFNSNNCIEDYTFTQLSPAAQNKCIKNYDTRWDFYFKYTGRFDFYLGTRTSGPVINRISNPALHLRKHLRQESAHQSDKKNWSARYIDLGLEHRSNGQVVDVDDRVTDPASADFGRYKTQIAHENDDHEYFDALSRGANYASLETQINLGTGSWQDDCSVEKDCFEVHLSAKPVYFTNDSNITWGELAGTTTKISDYDRYKIQLTDTLFFSSKKDKKENDKRFRIEYSVEWTLGDEFLDTDSLNASLHIPLFIGDWKIPIYIKGHTGPMKTLSNYTKEQDSIGIGVVFK